MRFADCHPDMKHYAKGMCNPCWQKSVANREKKKAKSKEYHVSHRDEILRRQKQYYKANADRLKANRRNRYVPHPRTPKPKVEKVSRLLPRKPKKVTFERPPAPEVLSGNDKTWWKLEKTPRHWL